MFADRWFDVIKIRSHNSSCLSSFIQVIYLALSWHISFNLREKNSLLCCVKINISIWSVLYLLPNPFHITRRSCSWIIYILESNRSALKRPDRIWPYVASFSITLHSHANTLYLQFSVGDVLYRTLNKQWTIFLCLISNHMGFFSIFGNFSAIIKFSLTLSSQRCVFLSI